VTLLTDFGLSDAYAGIMKGVVLAIAPDARIVDLTHAVPPQSVAEGAFILETACRYFPPGTVHLCVVDPGVGTARRRLIIASRGQFFVGPDNGLLSPALDDAVRGRRQPGQGYEPRLLSGLGDAVAWELHVTGAVSATFEGRDVFAPAAARLAAGEDPARLGRRIDDIFAFPAFRAPAAGVEIDGVVLHVDSHGNLISDIRAVDLPPEPSIHTAGAALPLVGTYAEAVGLAALVGSAGLVEISLPEGSAALRLGIRAGARVRAVAG
jgi:S-adenosylmethionine hydrolase